MKTPEEMAEEYLDQDKVACDAIDHAAEDLVKDAFLAGYKAAMKKYDIAIIEEKIKRESKENLMRLLEQRAKEIAEDI